MRTNSKIFMDRVASTIRNRYPNINDLKNDVESAGNSTAQSRGAVLTAITVRSPRQCLAGSMRRLTLSGLITRRTAPTCGMST